MAQEDTLTATELKWPVSSPRTGSATIKIAHLRELSAIVELALRTGAEARCDGAQVGPDPRTMSRGVWCFKTASSVSAPAAAAEMGLTTSPAAVTQSGSRSWPPVHPVQLAGAAAAGTPAVQPDSACCAGGCRRPAPSC